MVVLHSKPSHVVVRHFPVVVWLRHIHLAIRILSHLKILAWILIGCRKVVWLTTYHTCHALTNKSHFRRSDSTSGLLIRPEVKLFCGSTILTLSKSAITIGGIFNTNLILKVCIPIDFVQSWLPITAFSSKCCLISKFNGSAFWALVVFLTNSKVVIRACTRYRRYNIDYSI